LLGRRRNPGVERKNIYNVLFLCTGNSARSILAEAILNVWEKGAFGLIAPAAIPRGKFTP